MPSINASEPKLLWHLWDKANTIGCSYTMVCCQRAPHNIPIRAYPMMPIPKTELVCTGLRRQSSTNLNGLHQIYYKFDTYIFSDSGTKSNRMLALIARYHNTNLLNWGSTGFGLCFSLWQQMAAPYRALHFVNFVSWTGGYHSILCGLME